MAVLERGKQVEPPPERIAAAHFGGTLRRGVARSPQRSPLTSEHRLEDLWVLSRGATRGNRIAVGSSLRATESLPVHPVLKLHLQPTQRLLHIQSAGRLQYSSMHQDLCEKGEVSVIISILSSGDTFALSSLSLASET